MSRKKAPPIPGKMSHVSVALGGTKDVPQSGDSIEKFITFTNEHGVRGTPRQQIADYFEDVEKLCGSAPTGVFAEIRAAADALDQAIKIGDRYLIAVRALELGEYKFWPGATRHDLATAGLRAKLAADNAERKAAADAADDAELEKFTAWQNEHSALLIDKTDAQRVTAYIRSGQLKDLTKRRRLHALRRAGRIPPLEK